MLELISQWLKSNSKPLTQVGHFIKLGTLNDKRMGMRIIVREAQKELTNEVKKLGIMIDRHSPLELRVGDVLIFYISLGRLPPYGKFMTSPNRSL